jgi:nucleotidyltransferase/DNA polymerase involved in DNA repair
MTKLDPVLWERFELNVKKKIEKLSCERDYTRTWIHVDMDAFYAAVEMKDDPSLKDKPLAVEEKGMIMTTNYKGREYGVRSGIPSFIGKRLCPNIIFKRPNFPRYKEYSK